MIEKAIKKLSEEKKKFSGGKKEEAMMPAVYSTLVNFCKQDPEFAQAVVQGGSFAECMAAVAKGVGSQKTRGQQFPTLTLTKKL